MIDIIARGMIEESNGDISQISEKVNNHTEDSDIHVTTTDKENWNSHPNDVQAEGNPVQMDNLQGGVPFSEITVSGKNLLPAMSSSVTRNGITYTVNADGTITLNGTAEKADGVDVVTKIPLKAGVYTLSGCPEGGSGTSFALRAGLGTTNTLYGRDYGNGLKITAETDTVITVTIQNAEIGRVFDNVVFCPQLELGSTPTAYEPPITGRELTVNVSGKNLLPYPYADTTKTVNGITFTDNGDGTITANGTATANTTFKLSNNYMYKSGINYVVSGCPNGDGSAYKLKGNAEDVNADDVGNGKSFLFEKDTDCSICILIYRNATVDNLVFRPQLELGDTATPYEPYNGSVTTITPTSNPYIIPNDIRQQDGLNVVSVSEGEISVTGVRKNAAVKKIWDDMGMDLLFDGVTSADNPAVVDLANYKFVEIHHIMIANEKTYPSNIRLSLDNYLSSPSTIITQIHGSSINTIHTEEGMVSSLYAISAAGSNMNNTKIYGIK